MHLIVGLGNPGTQYAHTRHNVGFDVVDVLARKLETPISKKKSQALVGECFCGGEKVVLALPQTYMNLSGQAVQALMHWYKVPVENLIVIYDDIDLPPGTVRIRPNGGPGTHNGMRSIVECLGSEAFPRIRVGTGDRQPGFELADWVLSRYQTPEEQAAAKAAYAQAAEGALEWVRRGIESAMNRYNTKKPKKEKQPPIAPEGDGE